MIMFRFSTDKQDEESNDSLRRRNALIEINPQIVTKSDIDGMALIM